MPHAGMKTLGRLCVSVMCFMFDLNSCRAMQSVAVDGAAAPVAVAATSEMQFQRGKHRAIFIFFAPYFVLLPTKALQIK